jgi:hypothetical protein
MNSKDFTYFKLDDETYTFLGKSFKAPKAYPRNGNVDMFTNGAWKNSGKNINEVPDINLEEYELSFGLWMTHLSRLYNTVSSFASDITTPYQLLYQGNHTGFTYKLPYLINQGTIKGPIQNSWGGSETGIGESFAGSFGKNLDRSLGDIGKFFAEGVSYGGAGEKVRRYDSADSVKSITIKFPLYNTIDKDKTLRNFEFVTLFAFQNMKTRTSWMTYLPPKIYKVNTKSFGGINMPAAFVKSFDATAVGTVRKIRYKGFEDILIPEAYEVSITMEELLPESTNTFAATMGGDPVVVIGNTTNTPRNNININYDSSITPTGLAPIPSADLAYLKKQKEIAEANLTNLKNQIGPGITPVIGDNPDNVIKVNVGNVPTRENLEQAIKAQTETIKFIQTQIDQVPPTIGIQTAGGKVFAFRDLPSGEVNGLINSKSPVSLDTGTGQEAPNTFLANPKAVAGTLELPQSFLTSAQKLSDNPATQQQGSEILGTSRFGGGIKFTNEEDSTLINLQNEPKPNFLDNQYTTQQAEIISAARAEKISAARDEIISAAQETYNGFLKVRETLAAQRAAAIVAAPPAEIPNVAKVFEGALVNADYQLVRARQQLKESIENSKDLKLIDPVDPVYPVTQTLQKHLDSLSILPPIGQTSYQPGIDTLDGSKTFKVPEQNFSSYLQLARFNIGVTTKINDILATPVSVEGVEAKIVSPTLPSLSPLKTIPPVKAMQQALDNLSKPDVIPSIVPVVSDSKK